MDEKICGTYEVYILFLIFLIVAFGIPGILILLLNYPHITLKDVIASGVLLGIMILGILYMHLK